MKRSLIVLVLTFCLVSSVLFVSDVSASRQTAGVDLTNPVAGKITVDTTWTKANSPYQLEDYVYVEPGVTLTIEPGTRIEGWGSGIVVKGTLIAKGTSTDKIIYDNGFQLLDTAQPWNQETGTGCIIENCKMSSVTSSVAVKISECNFSIANVCSGSIISNNIIRNDITVNGSVILWKNTITGEIKTLIAGTPEDFPIIAGNSFTVIGQRYYDKSAIDCRGYAWVIDNTISHCYTGIKISAGWDKDHNFVWPNAKVERNLITDCREGIVVGFSAIAINSTSNPTIVNNEISYNEYGIHLNREARQLTITGNNIVATSNWSIYCESRYDLNAQGNYWGTNDQDAINQSIYDLKNAMNHGVVTFTPFLAESHAQAGPKTNTMMPSFSEVTWATTNPTVAPTETAEPDQTSAPTATGKASTAPSESGSASEVSQNAGQLRTGYVVVLALVSVLIAVLLVLVVMRQIRKRVQS